MTLPSVRDVRRALECFLRHAYPGQPPPEKALRLVPPPQADLAAWLMDEQIEREPAKAPLEQVRSFALRVGNRQYAHMKVRLTRPPGRDFLVFTVDVHDSILHAPPGSADERALAQMKRFNAEVARKVVREWDQAGLLTEHAYLRRELKRARGR